MAPKKSLGESDFSVGVVTFLKYSPAVFVLAAGAAARPCPAEALLIHPDPAIHRTVIAAVAKTAGFKKSFMTQAFYSIFVRQWKIARLFAAQLFFPMQGRGPATPRMVKSVII
jgi:hypothetical protein